MHNIDAERLAILRQIVENAIHSGWTLSEFQARMEVELHDHQQLSPQVERWLAILQDPLLVLAEQAPNRLEWLIDSHAPPELKERIAELERGKHSQSLLERAIQAQRDAPARLAAVEEDAQRRLQTERTPAQTERASDGAKENTFPCPPLPDCNAAQRQVLETIIEYQPYLLKVFGFHGLPATESGAARADLLEMLSPQVLLNLRAVLPPHCQEPDPAPASNNSEAARTEPETLVADEHQAPREPT